MLTIGLGASLDSVTAVTTAPGLIVRALVANYVLVPAAAVGLLLLYQASPMVACGFLIAAVCPGAPFGPPFTALAKGNVGLAVGLMVVLAGSSAVLAPLLLRGLIPVVAGDQATGVKAAKLLVTLFGAQLLPLGVGLAVRHARPALAMRLVRPLGRLSTLLNLATFGLIIAVQYRMLREIRAGAYFGMLLLVLAGVAAGWLLGGKAAGDRRAMSMATSVRNVGVAMVIATGSFAGTAAVTAATAFAVFQTIVVAAVAALWGRSPAPVAHAPARERRQFREGVEL